MTRLSHATSPKIVSVIQGEFAVTADPDVVMSTVLGSCIAACVYDPVQRVGGMNHFLLPEGQGADGQNVKYGAYLMELLLNGLFKMGADRKSLRVKLLGGGKMSKFLGDVGGKNIAFAHRFLQNEGLPIEWESLGGVMARRVHFTPTTGELVEKFVQNGAPPETSARLQRRKPPAADVELF